MSRRSYLKYLECGPLQPTLPTYRRAACVLMSSGRRAISNLLSREQLATGLLAAATVADIALRVHIFALGDNYFTIGSWIRAECPTTNLF